MNSKPQCPKCGRTVSAKPSKAWRFRDFDVKRYECEHCKSKFNLFRNPKTTYTIPKRR